jgi:hypothetical protein
MKALGRTGRFAEAPDPFAVVADIRETFVDIRADAPVRDWPRAGASVTPRVHTALSPPSTTML